MGSTREKSRQQWGAGFPKDMFVRGKIWRRKKLAVWHALERVATAWVGPKLSARGPFPQGRKKRELGPEAPVHRTSGPSFLEEVFMANTALGAKGIR